MLSVVISAVMIIALIGFWLMQAGPRTAVKQLDPSQIDYCNLSECLPVNKLAGLELVTAPEPYVAVEVKWGTNVRLRFVNHGRLEGTRELRLVLRSDKGKIVEMMRQEVTFLPKGPMLVDFFFTGFPEELDSGTLQLGY